MLETNNMPLVNLNKISKNNDLPNQDVAVNNVVDPQNFVSQNNEYSSTEPKNDTVINENNDQVIRTQQIENNSIEKTNSSIEQNTQNSYYADNNQNTNGLDFTSTSINPQLDKQVEPIPFDKVSLIPSIQEIFNSAVISQASDIHISSNRRPVMRRNGFLVEMNFPIIPIENVINYIKDLLKNNSKESLDNIHEIDLGVTLNSKRFRINIFKESGNFSIAARVISDDIRRLETLGFPQSINQLISQNSGLFLVTGPTGSGKSTTVASLINYINQTRAEHIITLEDPIEFIFPNAKSLVDQREFGVDFKEWPSALRAILRQDPDVVFVGEMRDYESIASTITISETGHLVFTTLHTNSSSQTVDRIVDVFPKEKQEQIRTQLSSVLSAVISQRLVPTLNGGRVLAYEIMVATPAVKNAIRESKTFQIDNIIQTSQDYGMISLERSLAYLVRNGVISLEVAQINANNRDSLNILLK